MSFSADDRWQKGMRDRFIKPWYERHSDPGGVLFFDEGEEAMAMQERGIDTMLIRGESMFYMEEKIVRWPGKVYTAICLETDSCTTPGHESPGWLWYSEADWLIYGCMQENDAALMCYVMKMPELRKWAELHWQELNVFQMRDTINQTRGRLAPINRLRVEVGLDVYLLTESKVDAA